MENVEAIAAIIGIVNGLRLLKDNDRWGFILFIAAVIAGLIFGFLGWFGLNIQGGFIAALASSGVYQVAKRAGGQ